MDTITLPGAHYATLDAAGRVEVYNNAHAHVASWQLVMRAEYDYSGHYYGIEPAGPQWRPLPPELNAATIQRAGRTYTFSDATRGLPLSACRNGLRI